MTHDIIDRLVRSANPVPDPKMLEPVDVSSLLEEWRQEMPTSIVVKPVEEKRKGGAMIWIAAAIAVVLGGLILFQQTEVAAGPTPVETAAAYVEAYAAFDADTVGSMLAPGADVMTWEGRNLWRNDLRFLEATRFQLIFDDCTEQLPALPGGVRVNCPYDAHGLGSDQIGLGPFEGSVFRLTIEDGLVIESNMGFDFSLFHGLMWSPFHAWIQASHPEDYTQMYLDPSLSRQTDDSIALWEQRVADYVESINNPTSSTTPVESAIPPDLAGA